MTAWNSPFLASNQWNSIIIIWHVLPLLTREVIKSGGDVFGGVSIRRVADNQAGFPHCSVPEKDALQQPLLWLTRPRGHGTVGGHRGSHGASVIHGDRKGTVRSNQAKEPAWEQESVWLRRSRVALVRKNYRPALYALPDPVRPTDSTTHTPTQQFRRRGRDQSAFISRTDLTNPAHFTYEGGRLTALRWNQLCTEKLLRFLLAF